MLKYSYFDAIYILTEDPLAPETTMSCRLLSGNNFSKPAGIVTLKIHKHNHHSLEKHAHAI